jgi:hypothetical protein
MIKVLFSTIDIAEVATKPSVDHVYSFLTFGGLFAPELSIQSFSQGIVRPQKVSGDFNFTAHESTQHTILSIKPMPVMLL